MTDVALSRRTLAPLVATRRVPTRVRRLGTVALVMLAVFVFWELASLLMESGSFVLPTPLAVVRQMWNDRSLYPPNASTTAGEAFQGFVWGVALATVLGILFVQISLLGRALMSVAIASYCIPVVAIGPILEVVSSGATPKVILAAIGGFFPMLIATMLGLRAADRTSLAMVSAYGGGSWRQLSKVRIRSALPSFFAGLRIAAPAAVVGAIIGEYLGGTSGLGVAMIASTQTLSVERTWGLAMVTSALALASYVIITVIAGRLSIVPMAPNLAAGAAPTRRGGRLWVATSIGRRALVAVLAIGVVLVGWVAFLRLFNLNSYFAKSPLDVFHYTFTDPAAAANRAQLLGALQTTIADALPGLVVGTLAGVVMAVLFVRSAVLDRALMPFAIALQSAPIVAMTPLIILTFGRDIVGITVIVALVTFFPTLLNVMRGLRSAPAESLDVVNAFGGSSFTALTKVQAQSALPALFASLKIAVPGAVFGTMLAEFLSTGDGLGFQILSASTNARFSEVWSAVVLITVATLALYGIVGFLESLTLRRYAPETVQG